MTEKWINCILFYTTISKFGGSFFFLLKKGHIKLIKSDIYNFIKELYFK